MSLSLAFFWTKSHRLSSMQHSSPWIGKVANDVFDGATGPTSKGIGAAQRYYCTGILSIDIGLVQMYPHVSNSSNLDLSSSIAATPPAHAANDGFIPLDLENCHLEVAPWQLYNSPGTAIRNARLLGKVSPALRIAIRLVGIVRLLGLGAF
ncbi:hypothetical protein VTP01DRAFT_5806 [Rhizomucor pusillus]|uniref:uncharacterized protein n=1 Tax=Rhizomucor pusillus TaxID=4840 RepID=UPI00374387D9